MALVENMRYIVQVYVGALSALYEALSVEASKQTTSEEIVSCIVERLSLNENPGGNYELAEVIGDTIGQECKERRLMPNESPVQLMMLWPKTSEADTTCYRFYLREKSNNDYMWTDNFTMDPQLIKDYFHRFLYQPKDREYPDLCQLPDLNEQTLMENLRARFTAGHIYTYVGSILIAVNPFKFHPIYNPKYVKLYQNRRLGPNLPPHIFAVADSAYHCMLIERKNHCVVISGESGSGKTESTNFLLHHLTALSQKGSHGSGVEQTILSAGPVLEAFGNAKTAHNNNSSRFGKFIQVNYKENGMVHGAVVQKYLLEKSRICSQGRNERNYHVFYYLLAGASEHERQQLHLKKTSEYNYLNRSGCYTVDNVDESYEFSRLKQSMEMVGFTPEKQRRLFSVLSAVLLLGNVEFQPRKSAYHHDEAVAVKNPEVVQLISNLLRVKQETLLAALTAKRARASGETLVINYRLPEAIASRDAMAKCLYGALFDWIVLQVNHALLSKKDTLRDHQGNSIGVLDIFGFEDFGACNSFEQLCINYANEHLQFYFNQHVFKYEQEEYRKEGIRWNNIDFMDNTGCLQLIEGKPNGLLCVLDDQCNFPGATSETLLQKFNSVHKNNEFYEKPQKLEAAFMVIHYAGKVKYQVTEMREKNLDLMRQDIVGVLKNSSMAFVRELVGADPVAVFRWAIVRAFFRAYFAFHEAGRKHRQIRADGNKNSAIPNRFRNHTPNDNIISKQRNTVLTTRGLRNYNENDAAGGGGNNHNRLSWPQFYYHRNRVSVSAGNGKSGEEQGRTGRKDSLGMGGPGSPSTAVFERVLCPDEARVMQRANQIVMKNKSFRPRERGKKGLKNLQTVKTLAGRTGITAANQSQIGKARKQPLTVAAQFQQSLHSLMDTLNQANPFFIRCIKSNGNKVPNQFDEDTVQRQLRYTGMLETVRIRQAGFNVRLTYDEFIQLYRILLPKGLLSSQNDVRNFLATLNLNRDNYQLGCTKIFLRESEKIKLDCKLHQQIMASIVTIQRWFRVCLERRRFVRMRNAVVQIQCFWRRKLAQRTLEMLKAQLIAAVHIQAFWRGYKVRSWYKKFKNGLSLFQAHAKGSLARRAFADLKSRLLPKQKKLIITSSPVRFLIKQVVSESNIDSGQEMLDEKYLERERSKRDSDESSGIIEDVESDSVLSSRMELRPTQSLPSVVTGSPARIHLNPPHSSHQQYYSRVEDTAREGIILDIALNKRKLSKTRNTAEISQGPENNMSQVFAPFRKCSCDSLTSYRSVESQRSSDSHNSAATLNDLPPTRSAPLMSTMNRSEVWDSPINKMDSDMDHLEQDTSKSAPPVIVRDAVPRFPLYDDEPSCWKNVPLYSFPDVYSPSKQVVTRTPSAPHNSATTPTSTTNNGRQEVRKRDSRQRELRNSEGLISLPPVRRDPRLGNESTSRRSNDHTGMKTLIDIKYQNELADGKFHPELYSLNFDKSPSRTGSESLKTSPDEREKIEIPTVPLRTIRKPRREIVCRSMGEEVDSGTTEAKNAALLGTIREANILGADLSPTKNIWQMQNSGQFIQHEAEMSLDTLKKSPQHLGGKRSRGIATLDLRRRNSDPATKIGSIVEQPGGPEHSPQAKIASETDKLVWKGHTTFTFAGHRFNKVQRFSKDDNCVYCKKQMDAFVAQGYKCAYCKKLFHTKCIQNGGGLAMPCDLVPVRRKYRKHSQTPYDIHKRIVSESKFNLTGTSEFTDRTDKIISDARELQLMQDFITKKIYKMESQEGKKPSEVDRVFKQALREFKDNLVATYSVVNKQDFESFNIKYKDLIANFLQVMKTVCHQEQKEEDFPVTMGVNAFRGFMNEFMTSRTEAEKPSKTKRKKEKKRKVEDPIAFAGHLFVLTIINIPTACEICSSFFMWPIERGLVCQSCKLTCHKKCYARVTTDCGKDTAHHGDNKRVFGIPLASLLTGECKIPVVLDRLITTIEMHGLYTEGIYRKSGVSSKVRELKTRMEETSQDGVNFEEYQMHVLASVLKSFLREMPEPLLTFDCYEDFLRAANLTDPQDRISTLFEILRKLPKQNFDLMERLIFHLARVALHEDVNRMNASALAIVFAPCVLRTNKVLPAQDSLNDIGRQTQCIETILMEQLRKVKSTLADIDTLDTACHTATHRLSSLRSSKVFSPEELQPASQAQQRPQPVEGDDEEALLVGHIEEIQKEKELLTSTLPSLTRTTSDDDMLSTDLDGEGSLDDISCTGQSTNEVTPNLRRARGPVVRSVSGGDPRQSLPPKLKRQSSSDISVVQKAVEECEDAPIMV